ncbi:MULTISPECIES: tRNA (adenine-N1)-methyltransferase [unclassified Meiothermus]|uniref:tRNA (adenine-N1)-methyltransferase n=1 Tax=unclassified Meiothermus TaxID=370471 RepID=UPI000D7CEAAB|nr:MULTISPECIES: tRNA (adenine-N1)-methyltransferase [unclassified Meiothermus]PZA07844.1 SAM-dependent methyltransferase [Meiothermus sp. Pnk-1]RYM38852.1 tRNA (adenine-N1)-methyltransferase [Meiothermus sp. PNK-Is4]
MRYGDWVLIQDRRGRKYLFRLKEGQSFDHHRGSLRHEEILRAGYGSRITLENGEPFSVHRPTLEDYALHMPREATPTYPKDAAMIAFLLDLAPGMQVLEAGSGSGGLTLFLARAVGPGGRVWSYESRERHQERAKRNLEAYETWGNVHFVLGDLREAKLEPQSLDGVALDLMEPWAVLGNVVPALKADRSVVAYLPNLTQVVALLEEIKRVGWPLRHERTLEVILRSWDVRPPIAHPNFQQVGHTAFLVQLRRIGKA